KCAVRCDDEIVVIKVFVSFSTSHSRVIEHAQLGRKPGCFLLPIEHEGFRRNNERGPTLICLRLAIRLMGKPRSPFCLQKSEDLSLFAQSHSICQATAKPEPLEEVEPAKSLSLVTAQLADEAIGRISGLNAGKSLHLVPPAGENSVAG